MMKNSITNKYNLIAIAILLFSIVIISKLCYIQIFEGEKYVKLAKRQTIKEFEVKPNRGNLYSDNGSLLATSITNYNVHFDTQIVSKSVFDKHLGVLCDSLASMQGKSSSYFLEKISKARSLKNKYLRIARGLSYHEYLRIKQFPIFNKGSIKGGFILEQNTVRALPMNQIASRTIGYERRDKHNYRTRVGLEGMFGDYLFGKKGKVIKQKIANGRWKPINGTNEIEPRDGDDVFTTLDLNIQYITHQALLKQLKKYDADHGSVIVMEVATGKIKAISNVGKSKKGDYNEQFNYAVGESHEPGSTFKLMSMVVALEDKVIDTNTVVNTGNGIYKVYKNYIRDTRRGGHGAITASKVFEVSSNVGVAKIINNHYRSNPSKFVNKLYEMGLNDKIGVAIVGEKSPTIPHPKKRETWYGTTLPWMAYGYGVSLTPLQTLAFYNAIANDGMLCKPRLLKGIKEWNKNELELEDDIPPVRICSEETAHKVQNMMRNVVAKRHGTGYRLRSNQVSFAGKTGTCQKNYNSKSKKLQYISSFAGYFPAENPKYSCIVVIHEPDKSIGYYGADVSGPVFKEIAEKIYTKPSNSYTVHNIKQDENLSKQYQSYYDKANKYVTIIPNLAGFEAMDAVALLENMGLQVIIRGRGRVVRQSIPAGQKIGKQHRKIIIELS